MDTNPKAELICELSDHDRDEQAMEWSDLQSKALTKARIDGGAALTFPATMADGVEELAGRENACCGTWLTATSTVVDDRLRLEITAASPEGESLILAMCELRP